MKCALPMFVVLLIAPEVVAQGEAPPLAPLPKPAKEIPLYAGVAPGSEKWDWSERTTTNPRGQPTKEN
jgi:hypothetical protein